MSIDLSIKRIRAFASHKGWSKSRLATEASLPDTTLRNFDKEDWNPTARTIRKIELIIPEEFTSSPNTS